MKVLSVNCVYGVGSTGKIVQELHEYYLENGIESVVYYGRGRAVSQKHVHRIGNEIYSKANNLWSRFTGLMYGGCLLSTIQLISHIKKEKPDIVHLHCINGYFVNIYRLISWLKKNRIKTVLTLHAEFMYTANCGCSFGCEKWKKGCGACPELRRSTNSYFFDRTHKSFLLMRDAFNGFGDNLAVVGVSEWLCQQATNSPILGAANMRCIYNGIDVETFRSYDICEESLVEKNRKMILWVTSDFSEGKGKEYFLKLEKIIDRNAYFFVVAGAEKPKNYSGESLFVGKILNKKELAKLYSSADVLVCCSKQESFPTVALEAQCCGTPVVGFDVGGVSEAISNEMGEVVSMGDIDKMLQALQKWAMLKKTVDKVHVERFRKDFSNRQMQTKYIQLYEDVLGR